MFFLKVPHIVRENLVPSYAILKVIEVSLQALLIKSQYPISVHSPCNSSSNQGVAFQEAASVVIPNSIAVSAFRVVEYLNNHLPQPLILWGSQARPAFPPTLLLTSPAPR